MSGVNDEPNKAGVREFITGGTDGGQFQGKCELFED